MRDVAAIALDAVPELVGDLDVPLSRNELAIGRHLDGLRSVDEIARRARVPVDELRALLLELAWAGSVAFGEVAEVDEIDIISEVDDAPVEAEPIPLTRQRYVSGSVLIQAVLAALDRMSASA